MKVLLLNPPAEHELIANDPEICKQEGGLYPPLGILYVAAYAEKHSGHKIELLDALAERLSYDNLGQKIKEIGPDVVGITTMSFTIIDVLKSIEVIRRELPHVKIVLGGPHVHLYPEETINLKGVDYLVLGEGELAFKELLDAIERKISMHEVKGIVFKKDGRIINTGPRELIDNLDELPFPARHLTHIGRYYSLMAKRTPITTMFTSRGCPYRCIFCDRPHLGKKFRARSPKNVVDEMEQGVNMGIKEFFIYDDTFTIDRKRVFDICAEIKNRRLDIGWDIRARVNNVDSQMLKALKAAGCERVHFGVESGNTEILKILKKDITLEKAREAFKETKKAGLDILAYFMIGSPGETKKEIQDTISFAKSLSPDYAHFTILTPFPGTEVYKLALSKGIYKEDHWRAFALNPKPGFEPKYWEENFTRDELKGLLADVYKSFYVRPGYIARGMLKIRSFGELKRKLKAGLKVIGM